MNKNVLIEKLSCSEVGNLLDILKNLADHHNKISSHFSGFYPLKPFEQVISEMSQKIKDGNAIVDVITENSRIIAFSHYSIEKNIGALEFLVVLPEYRNYGYGGLLMEKALKYFETKPIKRIELKVAHGNDDAKKFYERYGFRILSQNMAIFKE